MQKIFKVNNFDIIRLIAALQVAIHHTVDHLDLERGDMLIVFMTVTAYFPGVPVFFFVSGFLISKSYESNSFIREYAQNRILRIYPALIVCTFVALFSIYLTGYFADREFSFNQFIFWIIGQISFFQFYTPEFMREFGTGTMNGSLWTISVELQFYIMVPLLYWIFGLATSKNCNRNLLILIFVFMVLNVIKHDVEGEYGENLLFKLFSVSFVPWIWMFLVGVFFQKNFAFFHRLLSEKILYILPLYLIFSYLSTQHLGWMLGNGISPVLYLFLAAAIFSFAYSSPALSQKLLRRNDISYGVYIYHLPVINILIYYGYTAKASYAIIAITITIILAGISWTVFERNSMKLKKHPLNPLNTANKTISQE